MGTCAAGFELEVAGKVPNAAALAAACLVPGRAGSDMATGRLFLTLACNRKWPAGRVATALDLLLVLGL